MKVFPSGLRPILSPPSLKHPDVYIWFGISLLTPLYFGLVSLNYATSGLIIQDDARLHIVWLQRLVDPELFPHDAIADYYAAIQPAGFKALYGGMAALGLEPLTVATVVPLLLGLITTAYLFGAALLLLPVPLCGVLTTLVLNQNMWLKDDLVSATPRAFVYGTFAAFLYYLLRGSLVPSLIALVLQGLFYPQMMVVSAGLLTLRLIGWRGMVPQLPRRFHDWALWLVAMALTAGMLLVFADQVAEQVGRLVTLDEMKTMPEFQLDGRREYFGVPPLAFAFAGASGLRAPLFPPVIGVGLLLPWVLWLRKKTRSPLPLVNLITPQVRVLGELLLSAVGLFGLAHAVFPRLYLPSRYTFYSLRFVMAIATGIMLTLIVQAAWQWLEAKQQPPQGWTLSSQMRAGLGVGLAIAIITIPAIPSVFLPCQGWVEGRSPKLYQMLAQQPKDSLVASLAPDINNVPAFAKRSVLVGEEFALPYHVEFYDMMLRRMTDLVQAQYSPQLSRVQEFVATYGIDIWVVEESFATPDYLGAQAWLTNSSIADTVIDTAEQLRQGDQPALVSRMSACTLATDNSLMVLDAHCLTKLEG